DVARVGPGRDRVGLAEDLDVDAAAARLLRHALPLPAAILFERVQDFHQARDAHAHFLALLAEPLQLLLGGGQLARVLAQVAYALLRRLQRLVQLLHARAQLRQLLLQPLVPLAHLRQLLLEARVARAQVAEKRGRLADLVLEHREGVHAAYSLRMSQPRARSAATTASTEACTSSPVSVRAGSWYVSVTVRLTCPGGTGGRAYRSTTRTSRSSGPPAAASPRLSPPRARSATPPAPTAACTSSPVRVRAGSWYVSVTVRLTCPGGTGGRSYRSTTRTSRSSGPPARAISSSTSAAETPAGASTDTSRSTAGKRASAATRTGPAASKRAASSSATI